MERLITDKKIADFNVVSKTLESYYKSVEEEGVAVFNGHTNGNQHIKNNINNNNVLETIDLRKTLNNGNQNGSVNNKRGKQLSFHEMLLNLFLKRFLHFKRNYRLLICILVLPVIFEIIAMGFMKIRPPGDYDTIIEFNRSLYPGANEFYSNENPIPFGEGLYEDFESTCSINQNCELFDSSKQSFDWILKTHEEYIRRRYGGVSLNQSRAIVWYNNKGFHSMPLYLNVLNSAMLRKELNHSSYNIRTINHPLKLGEDELSVSSM